MPKDENDPVRDGHGRFMEACRCGDVDAIVSLLAENCVWMPTNETSLYGRGEAREWFEEYFADFRITVLSETEREVTRIGDWAVERWAYTVAIEPLGGGERIRDDGRFLVIWKKESDGQWRIFQFIFNSIRPIGSGTSRFMVRMMGRRIGAGSKGESERG